MSLFACENCGCVENTALCWVWQARAEYKPELCSACDPAIGKWHGLFERRQPRPGQELMPKRARPTPTQEPPDHE